MVVVKERKDVETIGARVTKADSDVAQLCLATALLRNVATDRECGSPEVLPRNEVDYSPDGVCAVKR